ncbi:MAG TPA: hypothetical protein VL092_12370 [Chitinophagaceae bacterium]|nr:hypothetical protein [Chitinophagaceae bacterium]
MSVLPLLASSLQRRDEEPNIALAQQIAHNKDKTAVQELVQLLSGKQKDLRHDSIKVLYETGALEPALLAPYLDNFLDLLQHKDNRLQWGAMTALQTLTATEPKALYTALPRILEAAESGSVITNDACVRILVQLCMEKPYTAEVLPLLNEKLLHSPENQLPMYAELALPVIDKVHKDSFIRTLNGRLADMDKESKRKRVLQVLKKLQAS